MSAFIQPSDENANSIANFMTTLTALNASLDSCGQWAARSLYLIAQIQEDPNFTVVLTEDQQNIIATCATQLAEAQASLLATLRPSSS